jgi:hypothetical protein
MDRLPFRVIHVAVLAIGLSTLSLPFKAQETTEKIAVWAADQVILSFADSAEITTSRLVVTRYQKENPLFLTWALEDEGLFELAAPNYREMKRRPIVASLPSPEGIIPLVAHRLGTSTDGDLVAEVGGIALEFPPATRVTLLPFDPHVYDERLTKAALLGAIFFFLALGFVASSSWDIRTGDNPGGDYRRLQACDDLAYIADLAVVELLLLTSACWWLLESDVWAWHSTLGLFATVAVATPALGGLLAALSTVRLAAELARHNRTLSSAQAMLEHPTEALRNYERELSEAFELDAMSIGYLRRLQENPGWSPPEALLRLGVRSIPRDPPYDGSTQVSLPDKHRAKRLQNERVLRRLHGLVVRGYLNFKSDSPWLTTRGHEELALPITLHLQGIPPAWQDRLARAEVALSTGRAGDSMQICTTEILEPFLKEAIETLSRDLDLGSLAQELSAETGRSFESHGLSRLSAGSRVMLLGKCLKASSRWANACDERKRLVKLGEILCSLRNDASHERQVTADNQEVRRYHDAKHTIELLRIQLRLFFRGPRKTPQTSE